MKKMFICLAGIILPAILGPAEPSSALPKPKADTVSRVVPYTAVAKGEETYYYDVEGHLAFTSRLISDVDLPANVIRKLIKRFPDNYIRRVMRFHVGDHDVYFITLESKTDWRVLRINNFNQIKVMQHLQKA